MNELFEIYKRIEYLRNNRVKMKELAAHPQMAASVLSSLYSSVLPNLIASEQRIQETAARESGRHERKAF